MKSSMSDTRDTFTERWRPYGIEVKVTTAEPSYIQMPGTGYEHGFGKHNTEQDRGVFVVQVIPPGV